MVFFIVSSTGYRLTGSKAVERCSIVQGGVTLIDGSGVTAYWHAMIGTIPFSKTNNVMPFDFGLEEEKILIELDGIQHFEQVSNWDSPDIVKTKDVEKMKKAVEAGYSVIHIFQPEVWSDEYEWKRVLKEQVERLKQRKGEKARCVFISRREVYGEHIRGVEESVIVERVQP